MSISANLSSPQSEGLKARSFLNIGASSKNEEIENQKTIKAAEEFEAMYFSHVIKTLFAETEGSGLFGESHGGELLKSIWINTIAKASHSGLGISKKIAETLRKNQSSDKKPNEQGGFYDLSV